jgi:endonuclease/exonuclease/phosphatase family metal-dependent hydrolase
LQHASFKATSTSILLFLVKPVMFRTSFLLLLSCLAIFCSGICRAQDGFTLATFNIRCPVDKTPNSWQERKDRCLTVIRNNRLDIFGIQEAVHQQLQDLLSGGEYAFIGGGRNDFKKSGEFSAILYRKERFQVLESGTFSLSEKPEVPGYISWNSACPRIATWGLFLDKKTGRKFIYYNTHLDHISSQARVNGIKLIVEHAGKKANGLPLILSGDFNAHPDSRVYQTASSLLKDSAVVSETPHAGPLATYTAYGKSSSKQPIDFVFVSDNLRVLTHKTDNTRIDGKYPSDHDPVVVTLEFRKAE